MYPHVLLSTADENAKRKSPTFVVVSGTWVNVILATLAHAWSALPVAKICVAFNPKCTAARGSWYAL